MMTLNAMMALVVFLLTIGFALLIYVLRQVYLNEQRNRVIARLNAVLAPAPIPEAPLTPEEIAYFNATRWD